MGGETNASAPAGANNLALHELLVDVLAVHAGYPETENAGQAIL